MTVVVSDDEAPSFSAVVTSASFSDVFSLSEVDVSETVSAEVVSVTASVAASVVVSSPAASAALSATYLSYSSCIRSNSSSILSVESAFFARLRKSSAMSVISFLPASSRSLPSES